MENIHQLVLKLSLFVCAAITKTIRLLLLHLLLICLSIAFSRLKRFERMRDRMSYSGVAIKWSLRGI